MAQQLRSFNALLELRIAYLLLVLVSVLANKEHKQKFINLKSHKASNPQNHTPTKMLPPEKNFNHASNHILGEKAQIKKTAL